jgi:hypothetical protein
MTADTAFSVGNMLALTGWAALVLAILSAQLRPWALRWAGLAVPALLAVAYVVLLAYGRDAFGEGGFSSIAGVRALFANDFALTAGWLHYLAFDLFVGAWIVREGRDAGMPGWLLLVCLPPTFLFGPVGLLLFFALRPFFGRTFQEALP